MTTNPRKLDNWLNSFYQWVRPRTQADDQLIFWAGAFTLATALRRKVYLGKDYLGGWTCYPHLYVMFVGPPGTMKTTTMNFAMDLLTQCPEIVQSPTITNITALTDSLLKSPDSSIYMTIEEFGDIILKGSDEMYEFLTSMYDGKRHIEQKTMIRGVEFINAPCINMIAATTPKWVAEKMPAVAIGGGFASRVMFVYVPRTPKEKRRFIYRKELGIDVDQKEMGLLEKDLVHDLAHIATSIEGSFEIDNVETMKFMNDWFVNMEDSGNEKLQNYIVRKHVHALKLSMLLQIAESDERIITKDKFEAALKIVELTEKELPKVFAGVGKNPYSFDVNDIINFVNIHPGVSFGDLLKQFRSVATPVVLNELVDGSLQMGLLKSEMKDQVRILFIGEDI